MTARATGTHVVSWALDPTPKSASRARHAVRDTLADRSWAAREIDSVLLVLSSLLNNAIVHACPPIVLTLEVGDHLRLCVRDGSPGKLVRREGVKGEIPTRGHGTWIIDTLADGCWINMLPDGGKEVWVAINRKHTPPARRLPFSVVSETRAQLNTAAYASIFALRNRFP
ncbi:ATP-binding protein [Nonomuraea endophytica]|uniref:ATP-binding protein n=1 Tax=Nonomuraea endophytica TaxID=714136 RepID=UPI0037CA1E87